MTGPEHYREAERLASEGVAVVTSIRATQDEARRDALGKKATGIWAQAQVHATLALAGAHLAGVLMPPDDRDEWDRATGRLQTASPDESLVDP